MAHVSLLKRLRATLDNRRDSDRGAVLVLTALVMLLLLIIAAFATDLGAWYRQGQEQQRAADVGALNGVLAYDTAVKAYFDTQGADLWTDLNVTQQQEAELAGLRAAAQTVIGLLETSGLTFSNAGSGIPAADPTNLNSTSEYTLVADDGTQITITRSWVKNGVDSLGNDVFGRSIEVEVVAAGDQYFSNIVRDAPQIERQASSVLSNCSADCSQEITLNPPLRGFNAAGSGDGFRPLVDLENERVWLMNHLWDSSTVSAVGPYAALGWQQIVCMDARTESACANWAPVDKQLFGAIIPDEAIDIGRGQLYYSGMGQGSTPDANGRYLGSCTAGYNVSTSCDFMISCVDTVTQGHCGKPLKISDGAWGGGPWFINDKIWAVSHTGNMFCIDPDKFGNDLPNPWCGGWTSAGRPTAATGNVNHADADRTRALVTGGVANNGGNKLVIYHGAANVFHCWDTANEASCNGFGVKNAGFDYGTPANGYIYASAFQWHDTDGTVRGWCVSRSNGYVYAGAMSHTCVRPNGVIQKDPISGLSLSQPYSLTWNQYVTTTSRSGDITMHYQNYAGIRNILNNGRPDNGATTPDGGGIIDCYDWVAKANCGRQVDAGDNYDFYAFTEFTRDCLVGVGDVSLFYSFSAVTGGPCSRAEVQETISPCDCAGTDEKRWGTIALPSDFLALLNSAHVFILNGADQIIDPTTGAVVSGFPQTSHPVAHDIVNDGPLVLDGLNGVHNAPLELLAIVDGKLTTDGSTLLWDEPKTIRYELVVQPTLAN